MESLYGNDRFRVKYQTGKFFSIFSYNKVEWSSQTSSQTDCEDICKLGYRPYLRTIYRNEIPIEYMHFVCLNRGNLDHPVSLCKRVPLRKFTLNNF